MDTPMPHIASDFESFPRNQAISRMDSWIQQASTFKNPPGFLNVHLLVNPQTLAASLSG
jgi:hypothetical protein